MNTIKFERFDKPPSQTWIFDLYSLDDRYHHLVFDFSQNLWVRAETTHLIKTRLLGGWGRRLVLPSKEFQAFGSVSVEHVVKIEYSKVLEKLLYEPTYDTQELEYNVFTVYSRSPLGAPMRLGFYASDQPGWIEYWAEEQPPYWLSGESSPSTILAQTLWERIVS